jgi:hypothetical protein
MAPAPSAARPRAATAHTARPVRASVRLCGDAAVDGWLPAPPGSCAPPSSCGCCWELGPVCVVGDVVVGVVAVGVVVVGVVC